MEGERAQRAKLARSVVNVQLFLGAVIKAPGLLPIKGPQRHVLQPRGEQGTDPLRPLHHGTGTVAPALAWVGFITSKNSNDSSVGIPSFLCSLCLMICRLTASWLGQEGTLCLVPTVVLLWTRVGEGRGSWCAVAAGKQWHG